MAWIEKRHRNDGGISACVRWRLGGTRDGAMQLEVFSAGTDAQNLARADGIKRMVDAAGQRWPQGWVRDHALHEDLDRERRQDESPVVGVGLRPRRPHLHARGELLVRGDFT